MLKCRRKKGGDEVVRYGQIVKARISDKNERHFFAQYEGENFTVLTGQIDIQKYQVGDQS